ncbi:MAG: hypothetical protein KF768_05250 [Phycisphaeraceae bacterium]|nr:hypothetical protein [Phycisphaeraceae bacterium]
MVGDSSAAFWPSAAERGARLGGAVAGPEAGAGGGGVDEEVRAVPSIAMHIDRDW